MSCYASAFEFYPGEAKTLKIQMNSLDRSHDCKEPFSIDTVGGDTVEIEVPASPANLIFNLTSSPAVVVDNGPWGIVHVDLTSVQTLQMQSGTILMRVTKSGKMSQGVAVSASRRLSIPDC